LSQYDVADRALEGGAPAELFQFTGGVTAYYATGQRKVNWNGVDYAPDWLLHGALEQSEELNKQGLEISVRSACPVAQLYVQDIPARTVNVRVYRYLEGVEDYRLVWAGRVTKPVFSSQEDVCVLHCEPVFTMLKRPGLRRNYQILCPYSLYDGRCGMAMAAYTQRAAVTAVDGGRITLAASRPDGYFAGGILRFGARHRLIISHAGQQVTVAGGVPGLAAGSEADVSAGCDKTLATCRDRFGNNLNFGGFPYIPLKNPFTGDSVGA
jgi:uncharacterized phage protein (TIGR02218 family)